MEILLPVIILGSLGLLFGVWLTFTHRIFAVEGDPRTEHIFSLLPGSNCGACGKAGCYGLAEALSKGEVDTIICPVAEDSDREKIAEALGIKAEKKTKSVATLICGGGSDCKDRFEYKGPKDCEIADLVFGGHKACDFGCTGFGSCEKVCPVGAISMGEDNLPHIDYDKCTACGKCIKICPKDVLILAPLESRYHIMCNSKDKGAEVMKVCKTGCTACGKCVKACPVSAISIKENLAAIDYKKCENYGKCIEVCPTKAIGRRERVGWLKT